MKAKRITIGLTLSVLGITLFSGQACPPNVEPTMPAPGAPGAQGVPGEPGPPGEMGVPGDNANVTAGDGVTINGGVVALDTAFADGLYWKLGGNAGTTPGADVIGTTDGQALELHVNGARALRLEPTTGSPNVIGGAGDNAVEPGVVAATIAGGGLSDPNDPATANRVFDNFGTIGGGGKNHVGNDDGNPTNRQFATVGGGIGNIAGGVGSTVAGGSGNDASGFTATIGGGGANVASGGGATVGGGTSNTAEGTATVAGGRRNTASGTRSTVSGGEDNTASFIGAAIGGGIRNTASLGGATVAGGNDNTASGTGSTVGGGAFNTSSGTTSTVGGGFDNEAGGLRSTVGGGENNTANSAHSTVGGGQGNSATNDHATVAGGEDNSTAGTWAFVGAGRNNQSNGSRSAILGGENNRITGGFGAILGGRECEVLADAAFAMGRQVKIANVHPGAILFADNTQQDFESTFTNEFAVRASGGVRMVTAVDSNGTPTAGVRLANGGSAWLTISDRKAKENFEAVDAVDVLERLAAIPLATWNYKTQDASIRHMGPMAQDFSAAFGVGHDDKHISTIDADGVALAAIQGLHRLVKERDAEIAALRKDRDAEIAKLTSRLERLEALMRHVTTNTAEDAGD